MTSKKREEFTPATKRIIDSRCRSRCVYPDCDILIRGGNLTEEERDLGYARGYFAHIIPASPKGPRWKYKQEYPGLKIRSPENGLLLCKKHHDEIDDPKCTIHPEKLFKWKKNAEKYLNYIKEFEEWEIATEPFYKENNFNEKAVRLKKCLFSKENQLIRIEGPIGIGKKTFIKYVLKEFLEEKREKILVIPYFGYELSKDKILDRYLKKNILIIYETPPEFHTIIEKRLKSSNIDFFKIITIGTGEYYDEKKWPLTTLIEISPLPNEKIRELIVKRKPKIDTNGITHIINNAKGIPGIAKSLVDLYDSQNLNPTFDEFLSNFCSKFEKRIRDIQGDLIKIKNVINVFSLFSELWWFKTRGWRYDYDLEGNIDHKVNRDDFEKLVGYSKGEIDIIVKELINIDVLRKRGRLVSISYPIFIFYLSENVGHFGEYYEKIWELKNNHFKLKYLQRLDQFAYKEEIIRDITQKILKNENYASIEKLNNKFNSEIIRLLSKIDHISVANHLDAIFKIIQPTELQKHYDERRNVIFALQHIIWFSDSFEQGMDILLKLSMGENETWENNATGVFIEKFRLLLPGTETSLENRMKYLKKKIKDKPKELEFVIVRILKTIFHSFSPTRTVYAEIQGNRPIPKEYNEFSSDEAIQYYEDALHIYDEYIKKQEFQNELIEIIYGNLRLFIKDLQKVDEVLKYWKFILQNDDRIKFRIIKIVENESKYYKIPEKIQDFKNNLKSNFNLKDEIHVAQNKYWRLKTEDQEKKAKFFAEKIRMLSVENERKEILEWLMQKENTLIFYIGNNLAKIDQNNPFTEEIKEIFFKLKSKRKLDFYNGYFREISLRNLPKWKEILQEIENRESISYDYYKLVLMANDYDSCIFNIIIRMNEQEIISEEDIFDLSLRLGNRKVDKKSFENLIKSVYNRFPEVISQDREYYSGIINLVYDYCKKYPEYIKREIEYLLELVLNFELQERKKRINEFSMIWKEMIILLIETVPETITQIISTIQKYIGTPFLPNDFKHHIINPIFIKAYEKDNKAVWEIFKHAFSENNESIRFYRFYFDYNLLKLIRSEDIINICNENKEEFPSIFIQMIGEEIRNEEQWNFVTDIWKEFSDQPNLNYEILRQFTSGVHIFSSGEHSRIHKGRLNILDNFEQKEQGKISPNKKILNLIQNLRKNIEKEKERTEEEDEEMR